MLRARHSSNAGEFDHGNSKTNSVCFFEVKNRIQNKTPVQIQIPLSTSTLDLDHQEVAALAYHRRQVSAVDEPLPHHEQSIRAVGDQLPDCNHVLLESKKGERTT